MLNQADFAQWCERLSLSEPAQALVARIRLSPPSRAVRSAAGNVSGRYPSRKMGVTIQFESHHVELAAIATMERDPQVVEFYDQPPQIKLEYESKNGRPVGVLHTPDFFVMYADSAGWEEWKTEEGLLQLVEKMPNRYIRLEDGRWSCPPGDTCARQFGLSYRVRSSAEIDQVYLRNLIFLEDYFRGDHPPGAEEAALAIRSFVAAEPGITLAELLHHPGQLSPDNLYLLIAAGNLYVDLHAAPLADPERVHVFLSEEQARAGPRDLLPVAALHTTRPVEITPGAPVSWDGQTWTILNRGNQEILLRSGEGALIPLPNAAFEELVRQGKITRNTDDDAPIGMNQHVRALLAGARPADHEIAIRRSQIIAQYLDGGVPDQEKISARTIRLWLANYRGAQQAHGNGYVGLLPKLSDCGNHKPRIADEIWKIMDKRIMEDYETHKQKSKVAVYGDVVKDCDVQGLVHPSYHLFLERIKQRPKYEQALKRQGRRAAYRHEPFYWTLEQTTPVHGDFPFAIGHIDHTQLDIELRCSRTGKNLGKPWATFLVDAFSRRLLAVYLTFDPPSYRSCMMVLRECVYRHGRLPQTVVVDGGKEFKGTYFELLLAFYECTKKTRPPAKARFGSVCERLFGTNNTQFVHNLLGNTQIMKNVRQVTKSVNPRNQAAWTLGDFYAYLCEWGYNFYDTTEHPTFHQCPRAAFSQGLAESGRRAHRLITYDEDFRLLTLPTTPKGTAKIQVGGVIKINNLKYWADAFRLPGAEGKQVPVRYDPYDASVAYAFIQDIPAASAKDQLESGGITSKKRAMKGHWVRCVSEFFTWFQGHSEREIKLASDLIRRQQRLHAQNFTLNAKRLAEFLASAEAQEALLMQRLHDIEARTVFAQMADGNTLLGHEYMQETGRSRERGLLEGTLASPSVDQAESAEDEDMNDLPEYGSY